ncbi:MAG TPA: tetratricopeptide repeat protein [Stellaceae bacterium]|nr:tetratricopeptide repeat protein [Stellaceae bacterium]
MAAGSREPHHHARLSHFLSRIDDLAGAETAIRQAVALAPGDANLRRVLVGILDRDGRYDEALAAVREMIAAGMRDEDALGWLGHLVAWTGNLAGAAAAFRQAVDMAPMQSRFRLALADTLDRDGRAGVPLDGGQARR